MGDFPTVGLFSTSYYDYDVLNMKSKSSFDQLFGQDRERERAVWFMYQDGCPTIHLNHPHWKVCAGTEAAYSMHIPPPNMHSFFSIFLF